MKKNIERTKGRPRKQDLIRIKQLEALTRQSIELVFDKVEIILLQEALFHFTHHINKEYFDGLNELPKNTPFREDLEEKQTNLNKLYTKLTFRD